MRLSLAKILPRFVLADKKCCFAGILWQKILAKIFGQKLFYLVTNNSLFLYARAGGKRQILETDIRNKYGVALNRKVFTQKSWQTNLKKKPAICGLFGPIIPDSAKIAKIFSQKGLCWTPKNRADGTWKSSSEADWFSNTVRLDRPDILAATSEIALETSI